MNETKSQHMGTVGKSTKFQLIRNTTLCDKLASIARIIKIISAVINRSIKLNLIINSTRFSLVSCRFSSNHNLSTRNEWMKRRITVWAGGWFSFGGVLITRRCRSTLRCATFWWSFFIFARLVSTSSRVVIKRWWLFYKHKNDTRTTAENERPACQLKRGEKRSDLVVPYGDQVMLAQALQKTFPNVFFFFFFDIKYQHFKNKIFLPCPV